MEIIGTPESGLPAGRGVLLTAQITRPDGGTEPASDALWWSTEPLVATVVGDAFPFCLPASSVSGRPRVADDHRRRRRPRTEQPSALGCVDRRGACAVGSICAFGLTVAESAVPGGAAPPSVCGGPGIWHPPCCGLGAPSRCPSAFSERYIPLVQAAVSSHSRRFFCTSVALVRRASGWRGRWRLRCTASLASAARRRLPAASR